MFGEFPVPDHGARMNSLWTNKLFVCSRLDAPLTSAGQVFRQVLERARTYGKLASSRIQRLLATVNITPPLLAGAAPKLSTKATSMR